ncbi:hypothetical protein GOP47_0025554 [Adiantum capillus-veneris]|uniref:Transcription elongation factor n=1 Tax=Adiantum capillus-veneris TaxID=13818 RepID=A0A9D4U1L9_ADICA|nr:hypothetical protein GOP47_0025554 [Adiantum capillus-veneris]
MGSEDELVRLFDKASKAADVADSGSAEESRCVEAIKVMHSFPVTTAMLISTQVGKRLRRLTKHTRPKIQKAASDLLEAWKKTVAAETKNGAVESSPSEGASKKSLPLSVKSQRSSERVVDVKMETRVKEESVASNTVSVSRVKADFQRTESSKDSSSSVKISNSSTVLETKEVKPLNLAHVSKTKDSTRDKLRESLAEALHRVLSEAEGQDLVRAKACDPIGVAVAVETVMFESLGGFHGVNKMKYRSIMFNIKDANNPDFRRKILLGDLTPGDIINLTPDQMASDQRKMENEEIKKKALFECERGTARQASTDQFKCGKCGQRKCTYYQLQTRSADEPMTTYVTCVNCNNRWKFC